MKKFLSWKIGLILIFTLFFGFFDLPSSTQSKLLPLTPSAITKQSINLGLDLQGGSQLDYKIDLREVPESDKADIIDGVQGVIEKRVNSLGVAEPQIYTSEVANETHIIVELADNTVIAPEDITTYLNETKDISELTDDEKKYISIEKAKASVGKTIQLEFKEKKTSLDPQEKDKIKSEAQIALDKINVGADYSVIGQEEVIAANAKVDYKKEDFTFESNINTDLRNVLKNLEIGQVNKELVEGVYNTIVNFKEGTETANSFVGIVKLVDKQKAVIHDKEILTSHILISYQGSERADASITRSKEEAYARAKEVYEKLNNTEEKADFAELAKEYSDEPGAKESGGKLDMPIFTGVQNLATEYVAVATALETNGQISEITETNFGYHVIKADEVKLNVEEDQYKYEIISYSTISDPWKSTGLTGKQFTRADVEYTNNGIPQAYITLQFNEEGAKLFAEITERNIDKPLAMFVGDKFISSPTVNEKITSGSAIINGIASEEEAYQIKKDLNTGAIPAPIILTGEYTIGATLGQEALTLSVKAGAIGLFIVMLFMILIYRLPGLIASIALVSYASILIFLIKSQLPILLSLIIALVIYGFLIYKILYNQDSGWEKFISFILSSVALIFMTNLLNTPITLTLAGVAGLILSIGMAVDANILIFERIKEEIQSGKTIKLAIDTGFERAWSAIRDSNFSTLITCGILFFLGSSIIKGFAFNLAAGVVVSMFTAITVTKTLLHGFLTKKLAKNPKLFGVNSNKKVRKFNFLKYSKLWMSISGFLVIGSIVATIYTVTNFSDKIIGLDFTGGSYMELNFEVPVEKETLQTALIEVENEINIPAVETSTPSETEIISTNTDVTNVDLTHVKLIKVENGYAIKTKYIDSNAHDKILESLKTKLPKFTESRFTTIGATIGSAMLEKSIKAIALTLILIILYIALAFRKITKHIKSWKFGLAAIVALLHDVIIVTGIFMILGTFLNVEIDALFVTAMLTVLGYSVNDTIVVFDRVRENLLKSKESIEVNTNNALNETLTRSLNTSLSTIITLVAILLMGSSSIFFFILALTAGIVVGTYSSIFLASPLLVMWSKMGKDK